MWLVNHLRFHILLCRTLAFFLKTPNLLAAKVFVSLQCFFEASTVFDARRHCLCGGRPEVGGLGRG